MTSTQIQYVIVTTTMTEQTASLEHNQPNIYREPVIEVPGISRDILETFREESAVGYALFKQVVECNDLQGNPDRLTQLKIILHFPKKFRERLEHHLEATKLRDAYFAKKKGIRGAISRSFTQSEERSIFAGELFEELVRSENKMHELAKKQDKEQLLKKMKVSRQLMYVWQYPEKFGIETHWRNPDAAFFEIEDDGTIVIKAVGEAKSGKLDTRAFQQLKEGGIKTQLNQVLRDLKSRDKKWFTDRNLDELADEIDTLHVDTDFKIRLIVPRSDDSIHGILSDSVANKLIKKRKDDSHLVEGSREWGEVTVEDFVYQLKKPDKISLHASAFSGKELAAMNTLLYGD